MSQIPYSLLSRFNLFALLILLASPLTIFAVGDQFIINIPLSTTTPATTTPPVVPTTTPTVITPVSEAVTYPAGNGAIAETLKEPPQVVEGYKYEGNVSDFRLNYDGEKVVLSWNNPSDIYFDSVRVMRSPYFYPLHIYDGEVIYEGGASITSDINVEVNKEYFYTVFAKDNTGEYSSGVVGKVKTSKVLFEIEKYLFTPKKLLSWSEIIFVQNRVEISPIGTSVPVERGVNFSVIIPAERVSAEAKAVVIEVSKGEGNEFEGLLLQYNPEQRLYSGVIPGVTEDLLAICRVFDTSGREISRSYGSFIVISPEEKIRLSSFWLALIESLIALFIITPFIYLFFRSYAQKSRKNDKEKNKSLVK